MNLVLIKDKLITYINNHHILWLITIALLFGFLTGVLSDQVTSFIYPISVGSSYINDPNMFYYMGKLFVNGYTPYIDFFDHKGPYIFYFTALAHILGGKFGMILLHTIVFGIFYFFVFKIYEEYKIQKALSVFVTVLIFSVIVICGQSPSDSEPIYPLISSSIYFYVKAINRNEDKYYLYGNILCGIFAGISIHLRAMEAIVPLSLVLYYGVINLKNRKYKNIIINALVCIGGLIAASIPPFIHSLACGFTTIMYKSIIVNNFSYASGFWNGIDIYRLSSRIVIVVIEAVVVLSLIIVRRMKYINNTELLFYSISLSIVLIVEFITAYYMHYLLTVFPFIFIFVARMLSFIKINKYISIGVVSISVIIGTISSLIFPIYNYKNEINKNYEINDYINSVVDYKEKNTILCYQSSASIYINNDILVGYPDFACQGNHYRISSYYTLSRLEEYVSSSKCKYVIFDNYLYDEFILYMSNSTMFVKDDSEHIGSKYISIYVKVTE